MKPVLTPKEANDLKKRRPGAAHRNGQKNAGQSSKTRTTILLAAARFCNWMVGEIGLSLLAVFGLPPLLGLAPWLPLPLIGGALLAVSAGIMEEAFSTK